MWILASVPWLTQFFTNVWHICGITKQIKENWACLCMYLLRFMQFLQCIYLWLMKYVNYMDKKVYTLIIEHGFNVCEHCNCPYNNIWYYWTPTCLFLMLWLCDVQLTVELCKMYVYTNLVKELKHIYIIITMPGRS